MGKPRQFPTAYKWPKNSWVFFWKRARRFVVHVCVLSWMSTCKTAFMKHVFPRFTSPAQRAAELTHVCTHIAHAESRTGTSRITALPLERHSSGPNNTYPSVAIATPAAHKPNHNVLDMSRKTRSSAHIVYMGVRTNWNVIRHEWGGFKHEYEQGQ